MPSVCLDGQTQPDNPWTEVSEPVALVIAAEIFTQPGGEEIVGVHFDASARRIFTTSALSRSVT